MPDTVRITKRQQDILRHVYTYRFLTRAHIQQLLHHTGKAGTNRLLAGLKEAGYIHRLFSSRFGENTKPAVYFAGLGAIAHYKTTDYAQAPVITRLYRDKNHTSQYIERHLLAADIALGPATQTADLLTPSLYANPRSRFNFITSLSIKPDLIAVGGPPDHRTVTMLEIFPKAPSYSTGAKIKAYLNLYNSGDFEDNVGLQFPRLILAFSYASQIHQARYLARPVVSNHPDLQFQIMTTSQLKARGGIS